MESATYVCPGLWVGDAGLVPWLAERHNELAEIATTAAAAGALWAADRVVIVPTFEVAEQVLLDAGVDYAEASFRIACVSGRLVANPD